jgi:acetolactate synthase regulatory subunit
MKVEIHPPATVERVLDVLGARGFRCSRDPHHPACVVAVRPQSAAAGGRIPA